MAIMGIHDIIKRDREAAQPEAKMVSVFREYYRGRQKGTHATSQTKLLRGVLGNLFAENVCKKIITEAASRHELRRFEVGNQPVQDWLDKFLIKNHLADLQQQAGIAMLRDGTTALSLRWQAENPERPSIGRVTVHRERWWDGTQGVFVAYDATSEPSYAVRDWKQQISDQTATRRVIWFPDHIERYIASGDGWTAYEASGDPEGSTGIVPWTKRDGAPLGLPVIVLPNGSDNDTAYGASELDGGVLGLQDEVNDVHRDITAAARLTGFQMYWATGTTPERDDAGIPKPINVGPGQVLQTSDPNARYGVLPAGNMEQLQTALMVKISAMCRMTDTPLHVITGEWPSGAALLRAEMPLVAKVSRLNKTTGPAWTTLAHRSTEIQNTFGELEQLDENAMIAAVFAPPERLDALTQAEIAAAHESLRTRQGLREIGYAEGLINQVMRDRDADRATELERRVTEFNRGLGAPDDGEGKDSAA